MNRTVQPKPTFTVYVEVADPAINNTKKPRRCSLMRIRERESVCVCPLAWNALVQHHKLVAVSTLGRYEHPWRHERAVLISDTLRVTRFVATTRRHRRQLVGRREHTSPDTCYGLGLRTGQSSVSCCNLTVQQRQCWTTDDAKSGLPVGGADDTNHVIGRTPSI